MSEAPKDFKSRENLREWLDLYAHSIPKSSVEGQLMDAQKIIESQQQRINELELMLSHIEQGEQATIAHQRVKIKDLCTALDNVLNHTSTDTIAEAAAVLERVRGEAK